MPEAELFDEWPERYEQWFRSPVGRLVRQVEGELVFDLIQVESGDYLLDAGCGTAVFTTDFIAAGASVVGLDVSRPMLRAARHKTSGSPFFAVQADMCCLPFRDNSFDKTVSITALEFIENAENVVRELFRVTKPGGCVLLATLNRLSPWAERRNAKTTRGQKHILEDAYYRSPDDLLALCPYPGVTRTAVHFQKDDDVQSATLLEADGRLKALRTGAFAAVVWKKPASAC